jgi:hypothetical protein
MKEKKRTKKIQSVELGKNNEAFTYKLLSLRQSEILTLEEKIEALTEEIGLLRRSEALTHEIHEIKKLRKSEFECDVQKFTRRLWNARITKVEHNLHLPINQHEPATKLVRLLDHEGERLILQRNQMLATTFFNWSFESEFLKREITRLKYQKRWFLIEAWATENDIDSETLFGKYSRSRRRRI